MKGPILTINAGSSSLKFALFEAGAKPIPGPKGIIEETFSAPHMITTDPSGRQSSERNFPKAVPFPELVREVIGWAEKQYGTMLGAVGHRVVHGGGQFATPQIVSVDLLAQLDSLVALAPLHEPHNIAPMRYLLECNPNLPQVACFDTSFHHTMSNVAARFAIPRHFEEDGIRRYGFHGLSYEYIAERLREIAPALAAGRVIVAHLGSGASICAMKDGRSIDTSMGFSALDGLVMGTRCGAIDPGVILHFMRRYGMGAAQIENLLYNRSGLLGLSGISPDMRNLLESAETSAKDAVSSFVFRLVREIGGLIASLGGLDALIFTAGIGEHSPEIRKMACDQFRWLGLTLDDSANARNDQWISTSSSRVGVLVVPTDEEYMIAKHVASVTGAR